MLPINAMLERTPNELGHIRIPTPFAGEGNIEMYLTEDLDIVHVPSGTLYKRPTGMPLEEVVYANVPDLHRQGEAVPLVLLLLTVYRPLGLDVSVYDVDAERKYNGPHPFVLGTELRRDITSLRWQWPHGGITSPVNGHLYVPAVEDTFVSVAGDILDETGAVLVPGRNETSHLVKNTMDGCLHRHTSLEIVSMALGLFENGNVELTDIATISDVNGDPALGPLTEFFRTVTLTNPTETNVFL